MRVGVMGQGDVIGQIRLGHAALRVARRTETGVG